MSGTRLPPNLGAHSRRVTELFRPLPLAERLADSLILLLRYLDAAGIAHPCDQRADQQAKQQDARIARALEHTDRTVDRAQCAHAGMEAGDQRLRSQQGEPQRSIDIARHQRDEDRQYRRQYSQDFQGPASNQSRPLPKPIRPEMPSAEGGPMQGVELSGENFAQLPGFQPPSQICEILLRRDSTHVLF